jgi:hypothetical protein
MLKYFLFWFPMLILAVLNGAARDLWYKNYVGELAGHQISTISLILLFGIYMYFIFLKFPPGSSMQSILVGILWLVLTLAFEFGFGLFRGNSLSKLLEDYHILRGRIWIFIPVWITIAPYLIYKISKH